MLLLTQQLHAFTSYFTLASIASTYSIFAFSSPALYVQPGDTSTTNQPSTMAYPGRDLKLVSHLLSFSSSLLLTVLSTKQRPNPKSSEDLLSRLSRDLTSHSPVLSTKQHLLLFSFTGTRTKRSLILAVLPTRARSPRVEAGCQCPRKKVQRLCPF